MSIAFFLKWGSLCKGIKKMTQFNHLLKTHLFKSFLLITLLITTYQNCNPVGNGLGGSVSGKKNIIISSSRSINLVENLPKTLSLEINRNLESDLQLDWSISTSSMGNENDFQLMSGIVSVLKDQTSATNAAGDLGRGNSTPQATPVEIDTSSI